ncbi:MAG: hypothetical protein E7526_02870 [Ruminococcaceae bacterium]|nr:hypothetical protein [Oscillospiraceae bacterium]
MKIKNFWNLFRHDLLSGIVGRWKFYLIACLVFSTICISVLRDFHLYTLQISDNSSIGISEFLLDISAGTMPTSIHSATNAKFPISWFMFHALLSYIVGFYVSEDIKKDAGNFIIRAKSRNKWWASKIVWCIITVSIYYLLFLTIAVIFAFIFGKPVFTVNIPFCEECFPFLPQSALMIPSIITAFLIPLATSLILSLLQIALCLFCRPIIVYICMIVYMIMTTYICNWSVLYNFTMVCRQQILADGLSIYIIVCFYIICIICINIIGFMRIRKVDVC